MPSFTRLATVSDSTKRSGGIVNGLEVGYAVEIAALKCTPLDPVQPEIAQAAGLSWHEVLETFVDGGEDIKEGDVLVVATVEYPIRAVSDWDWKGTDYLHLIVEQIK